MSYSSKLIEEAAEQMATLPGVGKKTALRLVLNLLKRKPEDVLRFANSIINLREHIRHCETCHNLSDSGQCSICASPHRDQSTICVVADIRDVMAIENTGQYKGLYHVLDGLISPMEGVGPSDLFIPALLDRAQTEEVKEIILALNATMEGETTAFYLYRKLQNLPVKVTTIARGVAVG
ncbi:MAG: recombination protein RecR, partial [Flavobacteriales bacterium]|nr:recombination protein RecR [Flavobacteriales bacterium]